MKVLLVKTSSLGDVIHALPAVSDAARRIPHLQLDWVVERGFAEIPRAHPAVRRVISVSVRGWRRAPGRAPGEIARALSQLRRERYDAIVDAQCLLKSALIAALARGPRWGLDAGSAREPLASALYTHTVAVAQGQHAILRVRQLVARALGLPEPDGPPDFGLASAFSRPHSPNLVLLHGTTWPSKHWPEPHWRALAQRAVTSGYRVLLPAGSAAERARAERIAAGLTGADVLPPSGLGALAAHLAAATVVIGVDSGLVHLAAALDVPVVALFGPSSPLRTGPVGRAVSVLQRPLDCAPCFGRTCSLPRAPHAPPPCLDQLDPEAVWQVLALPHRAPR